MRLTGNPRVRVPARSALLLGLGSAALLLISACEPLQAGKELGEDVQYGASSIDEALDSLANLPAAEAELNGFGAGAVSGVVTFVDTPGGVMIDGELSGLDAGEHAFHVHEWGDCSGAQFESAGPHFNPKGVEHGGTLNPLRHAGDLGNLWADEAGHASLALQIGGISLSDGQTSIIGRSLVVHAGPDDFHTQPGGASGARVACGVIKRAASASNARSRESP